MPNYTTFRAWRATRFLTVTIHCLLTIAYLWALLHASAMVPVVNKRSDWFFWHQFWIKYSSLLPYDVPTQSYVILVMCLLLFRIYQCSRCNFCSPVNTFDARYKYRIPFNSFLVLFFGPYLLLFIVCWLSSCLSIVNNLTNMDMAILTEVKHLIYCKLVMALLFKLLVVANALNRCIHCCIIIRLFSEEKHKELRNPHNLGDYIILFFYN
ncbi:uncharacterized protein LOC116805069 [Drosophila grimshawi]|uniref:uncharacterized protein LOC116805069 n=1 Tax=Drosophila grimshawi TaxID=7222 RepID=UPI000C86EB52|nr:uncharacterized protein LOC116805069 [Drosophila grimshawi]